MGEYTLTVTAREKEPYIAAKIKDPFPESYYDTYSTDDVTLTVRVVIDKATPELSVTASAIDYGQPLSASGLTGTATCSGQTVNGAFSWENNAGHPHRGRSRKYRVSRHLYAC